MGYKIVTFIISIVCFATMLIGCSEESTNQQKSCAKCGGIATTTLSGPAKLMESNGISLNDCTQVTSSVYSADICNSCIGPVHSDEQWW